MVSAEIMKMIVNLPYVDESRLNVDQIYDFIIEYMSEVNFRRQAKFRNIENIVKWLSAGCNGRKKQSIDRHPKATLKPGTKIKIQLSKCNKDMFNTIEKAQARLQARRIPIYQSHSDDSNDSDVDVVTPDYHSQFNSVHYQNQSLPQNNALKEHPPNASATPAAAAKRKRSKSSIDPKYVCRYCDKQYQQKSSLNRHEKCQHPSEIPTKCAQRPNHDGNAAAARYVITLHSVPPKLNGINSIYT